MAGHQLYDMMHSRLQSIATGTMSGTPGSAGPNLQLSPQMMQPTSPVPSPSQRPRPWHRLPWCPMVTFRTLATRCPCCPMAAFRTLETRHPASGFTAQSSMTFSLPEPQSARAAAAAATAPAAASSTNPTPTDTQPPPHYRGSRSCRRRRRHSHSAPVTTGHMTSRHGDAPPGRSHHPLGAGPPNDIPLRPKTRSELRTPTPPTAPLPGALPDGTPTSLKSPPHTGGKSWVGTRHSWGKHSHSTSNTGKGKLQSWQQQQSWQQPRCRPFPAPAAARPTPPPNPAPSPNPRTPWMAPRSWSTEPITSRQPVARSMAKLHGHNQD